MRKLILLAAMAAISVPSAAIAQRQDRRDRVEVRKDRQEVRRDRREIRRDRRDVRQDRRIVGERRIVNRERRIENRDRRRVAYAAPYRNWRYRRVNVGFQLRPVFYSPRYYISDYGYYRLPPPRHSWLRWIRYGDDLLLVNIRTGRVLDVVHYRYW
jgi:Ni/Co efflux regulator RcnB